MTRTKTTQTEPKAKLRKPPVIDRARVSLGTCASSAAPIPVSPVPPPPPTDAPAGLAGGAPDSSATVAAATTPTASGTTDASGST